MAKKDPAFLFYPADWTGGTSTLSRFLKGCYMDILVAQFNCGRLSLEEIKTVLGSDFGSSWPTLQKKFTKDQDGLFFNEKLQSEVQKRKDYSKKQKERIEAYWKFKRELEYTVEYTAKHSNQIPIRNENENSSIGIKFSTVSREIFFNDLPNSQELETIAIDLGVTKESLVSRIPEFRKAAEVDYPSFQRFCGHFKNWLKKNPAPAGRRFQR